MKHINNANQLGHGLVLFCILVVAFFAGFIYTQLQTATILTHPFIRTNTKPATIVLLPTPLSLTKKMMQYQVVSPTPKTLAKKITIPTPTNSTPWGVAQKIGEHTYTIKLGKDDHMGTPHEVLDALNIYRQAHGKGQLQWDDILSHYAQDRAGLFKTISSTDEHKGLNDFLDHQDGFVKLGYNRIGENSYYGGPLFGVHVIEWLFASSPEHNANQLDSDWSYAGVGTTDTSVDVIFGGSKM